MKAAFAAGDSLENDPGFFIRQNTHILFHNYNR
jgi:hypothetical protein